MTGTGPPLDDRAADPNEALDRNRSVDCDDSIELAVPARVEFAPTLHVLVAAIGADLGFSVDEIDDVNLAVSEILHAADAAMAGRVAATFCPHTDHLAVEVVTDHPGTIPFHDRAVASMREVVDDLTISDGSVVFVKRATESVG